MLTSKKRSALVHSFLKNPPGVRYSNSYSVITRVVLRSCPYLCRGTDIPQQLTYGFCYLLREELSIRNISLFDSGHQYLIIRLNASIFTLETEGIAALGYIVVDLCGIIMGKATHYLIIIQQWQ